MSETKWFKGNIHAHTSLSDGDATPQKVIAWYRRHGYDFLVLSDHNHLTVMDSGTGKRRRSRPLLIPGEEVSVRLKDGAVPIHINGIGVSRLVEPVDAGDIVPTLQANIDAILQAGGIASINHPNFSWAFDHEAITRVTGASFLEVFNGYPGANLYGGQGKPSLEDIWDRVLSAGRAIFGVAADDSHNFYDFSPKMSNPGRGWVTVRASELEKEAILEALASGDFYASTGVTLAELELSRDSLCLKIEPEVDYVYTTRFTGRDGAVLSVIGGLEARYQIRGDEGYVRATVWSSSGTKAWTQPVFLP